ncbi:MAG: GerMN domain-containing protein [Spirochaeta sp.]|jgi:hypothetical protein|nr:GerMN domain-containing protein [Spirochaeta sp.]
MKNLELNKVGVFATIAGGVLFVITAVLYVVLPTQQIDRYNLAFPDTAGGDVHHEWRNLPDRTGIAAQSQLLVEEMMLGPVALGAVPFISEDTELNSVIFADAENIVYLDFSPDLIVGSLADDTPFVDVVELLTRNLTHNIRGIESIVITISGQLPDVPRFDPL